jgi:hypothetical protein
MPSTMAVSRGPCDSPAVSQRTRDMGAHASPAGPATEAPRLVTTLAGVLGVPRRDVTLVRGEASRSKLVEVRGLTAAEVSAKLAVASGGARG